MVGEIVTVPVSVRVGELVMIKDGVIENIAVAVTTCGVEVAGGCVGVIIVTVLAGGTGGLGLRGGNKSKRRAAISTSPIAKARMRGKTAGRGCGWRMGPISPEFTHT